VELGRGPTNRFEATFTLVLENSRGSGPVSRLKDRSSMLRLESKAKLLGMDEEKALCDKSMLTRDVFKPKFKASEIGISPVNLSLI